MEKKPRIAIIDYGMGNIFSVQNALVYLGYDSVISNKVGDIENADRLILPGVGAFSVGMQRLEKFGLVELLEDQVVKGKKPILGICLGAQLFARKSYEGGEFPGLGWIDAEVVRIEPKDKKLKIPHIGWNDVQIVNPSVLFEGISEPNFYFVHSYHVRCKDRRLVTSEFEYGGNFTASVESGDIYGAQFHPEKSQSSGLKLLKNFVEKTR
ncbi:MAG: imidazole glycerol phosphate synthase subunit HisH [Candidatus Altiarchaeota archaeon]|nr:imidazole glycerol phosphate synthase subunit HisH [Candidatus Altiarchaeota archaeon]